MTQVMTQQAPPRAFWLVRQDSPVAEGVLWSDGVVAVRWRGQGTAVSVWSGGLDAFLVGHGQDESTEVRWTEDVQQSEQEEAAADQPATTEEPLRRPPPYLPAPGLDGRCVRCRGHWPCVDCGF